MFKTTPKNPVVEKRWTHDLFSCCDEPLLCCFTSCCPCCAWGMINERASGEPCWLACCIACLLYSSICPCVGCAYCTLSRTRLRNKYDIPGSFSGDCITKCWTDCLWCCCCTLTQEWREVDARMPDSKFSFKPDMSVLEKGGKA